MRHEAASVTLRSGLRLSFAEAGEPSGPALVLLPGPTDSWWSYAPVIKRTPPSVRAIAVSQRGHGDSDKPANAYRVEDFAADVPDLLDALGIERAVLAGHSGSCLVARRVAIDHPDRVAGLVLEASPVTLRHDPALEQLVHSVVAQLQDPIDPELARSFLVETSSPAVGADVLDRLVGELLKVPARVWRQTFAGLLAYDDVADLGGITAPTRLIWGDEDGLVDRAMQDFLARQIPGAELVVYAGVGHTPRWEDPARFASDIAAIVHRHG